MLKLHSQTPDLYTKKFNKDAYSKYISNRLQSSPARCLYIVKPDLAATCLERPPV